MNAISRRNFLKTSGALAAAACAGMNPLAAKALYPPIGLQLYSVRDLLPKDFDGTLRALYAAGYREVEAAGYYDRSAKDFRKAIETAGLKCVSTHHSLNVLRSQLDEMIAYAQELGLKYMVCSSSQKKDPSAKGPLNLDDWKWVADELNHIGEKVGSAGMLLGYHNHTPEFGIENGTIFYDELLRLTNPNHVIFEMDCGWVSAAGFNPVTYLKKSPGRFHLLHIKDLKKDATGKYHSYVLGRGTVDYKPILAAATGLKHAFIEQEEYDMDPMEALKIDAAYMRKLGS